MNCLSIFLLSCFLAAAVNAGEVLTDKPLYNPGDTTYIDGLTFGPGEIVTLQVTLHNGTPLRGEPALPWTVQTNTSGSFESNWLTPPENWGDTLLLTAAGSESADTASVSFISGNINLDQLQNGTTTSAPQWANGNINGTNSCYSEGSSVPYRYFLDGLNGGTTHFFTIQSEWTKGTIHALDYLANFNATEDSAITLAGGPCGTIATSPPTGCVTPTDSILFWDFTDSNNYTGTIPSDFFTIINPGFVLDGPRYLKAYNVTSISFDSMWFTGTASDRELNVKVRFTVDATGSVGFFWGGHLAEGTNDAWGFGMGSASVSGAPYHMRAVSFDGGGGSNQDRSIQNGVICLPPDAAIVCDGDTVCNDTSYKYVCRDTSTAANKWSWTLINGTIVGSSSLDSVKFQVSPGMTVGDTVWIIVTSCDTTGGCPGDFCCASDTAFRVIVDCNNPPVATCHADTAVFLCDLGSVCIPGFSCYDPDGNLVSCAVSPGTLSGDTVCFTPAGAGIYTITLIATDAFGEADTCTTNVTVTVNSPPVATCAPNDTLFVCNLDPICVKPFSCSDIDGNLVSCVASPGTLVGDSVCFTPVDGDNIVMLVATDACGDADTCYTTIHVDLNSPPVATCAPVDTLFVCDLSPLCIPGFSCYDADGNLTSCVPSLGTLSNDTVCFTPIEGDNNIMLVATDDCGEADTCYTTIRVELNTAPVCDLPNDTTIFQCSDEEICRPVGATDVDGNFSYCEVFSGSGSIVNGEWCFTPTGPGVYSTVIRCYDSCGAFCQG
ncbi:MAG TPA: hypothetical protein VN285_11430, partial [Candidatus Deferrimicrobium sp.]|nr:hypothetical protein [Candidatus Deferrimicrobium sp.]